ncbi:MAG: MerR family transcriptional regulator [Ktedonobacteraceae bacterium]
MNKKELENYYTPQQVRELLGINFSALQNHVNRGNLHPIAPPGRKHKLYPKQEVNDLRAEEEAFFASRAFIKSAPAQFVKATPSDMPQAVQLASVFGGDLTIPLEKRLTWLEQNPDIDYFLKQEDHVVGYLSFVPLRPETIEDLLHARRFARELEASEILPYIPDNTVDIYCMAIFLQAGISKMQKRIWGELLLLGARRVIIGLGQRGIVIRSLRAHSSTPDGINLMRHIGFTEIVSSIPGMRDFLIDIEQSGLPFAMDYKKALNDWQRQHAK